MPAPLASRPGADHFQTGDTDVPVCQRDCSWLHIRPMWDESPTYQAANTCAQLHHLHLPFQLPDVLQLVLAPSASVWNKLLQEIRSATSLPFSDVGWKLIFSIVFNSCKVIEVFPWKYYHYNVMFRNSSVVADLLRDRYHVSQNVFLVSNNFYAPDEQGDNPGQKKEGSTVSSINCDCCWCLD